MMSKLMMISRVRGSDPRIKCLVIIWLFWDQNIPGWILWENPGTKELRKSRVFGIPSQRRSLLRTVNLQETVVELEISCSKNSERKKQMADEILEKWWKNCSQLTRLINWAEYCSDSQRSRWQSNYSRSSIEFHNANRKSSWPQLMWQTRPWLLISPDD